MPEQIYRKISFELQQDEDGYPPDRWEVLWAYEEEDLYCLDNIPFYAKGISSEDRVSAAEDEGGQLTFKRLMEPSSNSVFRLFIFDAEAVQSIRDQLRNLGCESELSNHAKLIAVEVPGNIDCSSAWNIVLDGAAAERWEYEVGVMRHKLQPAT